MSLYTPRHPQGVHLSVFSYLVSATIQYQQQRCASIEELEAKLGAMGIQIGLRLNELLAFRAIHTQPTTPTSLASALIHSTSDSSSTNNIRHSKIVPMLQYIHTAVWKYLFGVQGDGLEKSAEVTASHKTSDSGAQIEEYYLFDRRPITNLYISPVGKNMSEFNASSLIAGCIQGILESAEFAVAGNVTAHHTPQQSGGASNNAVQRTVYVIRLASETVAREQQYKGAAG